MLKELIYGGLVSIGFLGLSNCFCDPAPPYVDFSEIEVHSLEDELQIGDTLNFYIDPSNPQYISQIIQEAFGPQKAFATSCPHPGDQGMKFPIEEMTITSQNDFDSNHLAGTSLNDLFLVKTYSGYAPLSDSLINSNILQFGLYEVQVMLTHSPSLKNEQTFTFELIKSNSEVITGSSEKITWR